MITSFDLRPYLFLILFVSFNTYSQNRHVIYTDQDPPTKAEAVIEYFKNTVPFNEFDYQFEIRSMSSEDLGCNPYPGIPRLITCDENKVSTQAFNDGFDQAFIISDNSDYGGSGGSVPVITSSDSTPVSMLSHEYLHRLGFCDEYQYAPASTANYYCTESNMSYFNRNVVLLEPLSAGYGGDSHAREVHGGEIPWFSNINDDTPIATNSLGTPGSHSNMLGLFPADVCDQATPPRKTWRAGGQRNIMQDLNAPITPYEDLIREAIAAKGIARNNISPPPPPQSENCYQGNNALPIDERFIKNIYRIAFPE